MIRAAALSLALFTAAPALAWGPHFGPRVRVGFIAPRIVPPVVVAPVPYVAPAPYYGGYYARPYYAPRFEHRYGGHYGRRGWR